MTQKRILSLFVALMMIFSLCGCQGNPVSEQTESERFEEYLDEMRKNDLITINKTAGLNTVYLNKKMTLRNMFERRFN